MASPYTWNLSNLYTTGEVVLTAVPEPDSTADFNSDDRVDGGDLSIWDTYFGTPNPISSPVHEFGDADEDTDIDGRDFLAWQSEYGLGVAASTSSANVPEPATNFMLLLGMTVMMLTGGRTLESKLNGA